MAWTAPRTWVSGELVSAALMNGHVRDNLTELRAGGVAIASQAALDLIGASSATQLSRIAKGTALQVLRMNSDASAQEWSTPTYDAVSYTATLADVANTTSETTVLSFVVPGNAMADGDVIQVWWSWLGKNNAFSPLTVTVKTNVGAGAQVTVASGSWSSSATEVKKATLLCYIMRVGSTTWIAANPTYDILTKVTNIGESTPTNFTGDNTVSVKVTLDGADATAYLKPQSAMVIHYRN